MSIANETIFITAEETTAQIQTRFVEEIILQAQIRDLLWRQY